MATGSWLNSAVLAFALVMVARLSGLSLSAPGSLEPPASLFFLEDWFPGNATLDMQQRRQLRDEAAELFYHAFDNYMEHGYPDDELKPLSCTGRRREGRGSADDHLGDFQLSLIESLDMLAILGDKQRFQQAFHLLTSSLEFSSTDNISVFETTIRVLGGLVSAHMLAVDESLALIPEYDAEFLLLAEDLAQRLLPAFDTPTGIPVHKIRLSGGVDPRESRSTCLAAAGSLILEFGALSNLTGDAAYARAAERALHAMWTRRSGLHLLGTDINIDTGYWSYRGATVGVSADSFYEYIYKSYQMFGDRGYKDMFDTMYTAIQRYLTHDGYWYAETDMNTGAMMRTHIHSCMAFWPGLQAVYGDVSGGVRSMSALTSIMRRFGVFPEAYDPIRNVIPPMWGAERSWPLRPELIESAYHLYQRTNDPHYLRIARQYLRTLQRYNRVECGVAGFKDVTRGVLADSQDSFFLAETIKYLYLIFDPDDNLVSRQPGRWIFNTEGHILDSFVTRAASHRDETTNHSKSALSLSELHRLRQVPTHWHVLETQRRTDGTRVEPSTLQHVLTQLRDLGVTVTYDPDRHSYTLPLQRVAKASPLETLTGDKLRSTLSLLVPESPKYLVAPALFGQDIPAGGIKAPLVLADPPHGCSIADADDTRYRGAILVVHRGTCMFVEKASVVSRTGALAMLVVNSAPGDRKADTIPEPFIMSGHTGDADVSAAEQELVASALIAHADGQAVIAAVEQALIESQQLVALLSSRFDRGALLREMQQIPPPQRSLVRMNEAELVQFFQTGVVPASAEETPLDIGDGARDVAEDAEFDVESQDD